MNHRSQRSWKDKFMKSMIAATAIYAIFIKKSFIFAANSISVINLNSQMINETFTFIISTKIFVISIKSALTSIDLLLEHVLFNDITVYDIKSIAF